jgi:hypothetical protein
VRWQCWDRRRPGLLHGSALCGNMIMVLFVFCTDKMLHAAATFGTKALS